MSHYSVLVIGEDVEKQLEPYYEQVDYDNEEDRQYMTFKDDSEYKAQYKENKVLEYGDDKGKKLKQVYPTYEKFLDDYACLEIDKHTGKRGYWHNPNSKWDWYEVGGRWTGFFKLKKGTSGKTGRPGLMTDPALPGFADEALLKDIDFKGMRTKSGKEAKERYERLETLLGAIPKMNYLWTDIVKSGVTQEKRDAYHAQPAKKLVSDILEKTTSKEDRSFLTWLDLEDYQVTKEEYIQSAKDSSISTFAVVKGGEWFEKGKMGWWACVSNEKEQDDWDAEFNRLLDNLPEDTRITLVDCHI